MVFKPVLKQLQRQSLFENDVKMYGIQTRATSWSTASWFENDVKMYGIQTTVMEKRTSDTV